MPAPPLNEFVECLWFYKGFFPDHSLERVLPDGAIEILIDLEGPPKKLYESERGGHFRAFQNAWISGQHSGFIVIGTEQNSSMMGVRFRPGGAHPFLPFPVNELNDDVVDMACVWGTAIRGIYEQILSAPTPDEKFRVVEQALLKLSHGTLSMDPACAFALRELSCATEDLSIRELASRVGLSQRQLLRRFEKHVGLGPKVLARVFRFQNVVQRLSMSGANASPTGRSHQETTQGVHWAEIANDAGYYDQSHFVRDFQQFTGLNPSRYLIDKQDYENFIPIR
jgi:AraC-like DNA-binding protein